MRRTAGDFGKGKGKGETSGVEKLYRDLRSSLKKVKLESKRNGYKQLRFGANAKLWEAAYAVDMNEMHRRKSS